MAGHVHDQPEVCPDHAVAGFRVTFRDAPGKESLILGGQKGRFVDLAQIAFESGLDRSCSQARLLADWVRINVHDYHLPSLRVLWVWRGNAPQSPSLEFIMRKEAAWR